VERHDCGARDGQRLISQRRRSLAGKRSAGILEGRSSGNCWASREWRTLASTTAGSTTKRDNRLRPGTKGVQPRRPLHKSLPLQVKKMRWAHRQEITSLISSFYAFASSPAPRRQQYRLHSGMLSSLRPILLSSRRAFGDARFGGRRAGWCRRRLDGSSSRNRWRSEPVPGRHHCLTLFGGKVAHARVWSQVHIVCYRIRKKITLSVWACFDRRVAGWTRVYIVAGERRKCLGRCVENPVARKCAATLISMKESKPMSHLVHEGLDHRRHC
jgi:hypothetical protein